MIRLLQIVAIVCGLAAFCIAVISVIILVQSLQVAYKEGRFACESEEVR